MPVIHYVRGAIGAFFIFTGFAVLAGESLCMLGLAGTLMLIALLIMWFAVTGMFSP
ncbi:MAG: hypothetical protein M3436_01535 [Pseudomonadota bacterium]|nr:hypothetical protein [Pseudomonadota bacterium]